MTHLRENTLTLKTPVKSGSATCACTLVALQHIDNEDTEKIGCMLMKKRRLNIIFSFWYCSHDYTLSLTALFRLITTWMPVFPLFQSLPAICRKPLGSKINIKIIKKKNPCILNWPLYLKQSTSRSIFCLKFSNRLGTSRKWKKEKTWRAQKRNRKLQNLHKALQWHGVRRFELSTADQ